MCVGKLGREGQRLQKRDRLGGTALVEEDGREVQTSLGTAAGLVDARLEVGLRSCRVAALEEGRAQVHLHRRVSLVQRERVLVQGDRVSPHAQLGVCPDRQRGEHDRNRDAEHTRGERSRRQTPGDGEEDADERHVCIAVRHRLLPYLH